MRRDKEDYIRKCDPCQRRKEGKIPIALLGEVPSPKFPFEITAMDVTGPYVTTPRGNKYLLTFIDHFSRYVGLFPSRTRQLKHAPEYMPHKLLCGMAPDQP